MRKEKIITIYPTIVKAGLVVGAYMPPDPIIVASEYPSSCSFYLTALMYFDQGKKYTTELDVTYNGESVLPDNNGDENSMETFMFSPINEASVIVGTMLLVNKINIIGSGVYDITYRIFEDTDAGLSEVIDEKKCALISANPVRS